MNPIFYLLMHMESLVIPMTARSPLDVMLWPFHSTEALLKCVSLLQVGIVKEEQLKVHGF